MQLRLLPLISILFIASHILNVRTATLLFAQDSLKIDRLLLIDAESDTPIREIHNDDTINLSELPTKALNVQAIAASDEVRSVVFQLNQHKRFRHETAKPFALAGDSAGNYTPWTPKIGRLKIVAIPEGGKGKTGESLSITVTVVDEKLTRLPIIPPLALPEADEPMAMTVHPLPLKPLTDEGDTDNSRSAIALQLAGYDLEVGSCEALLNKSSHKLRLDCKHFLKNPTGARLYIASKDDKNTFIPCKHKRKKTRMIAHCSINANLQLDAPERTVSIQLLGDGNSTILASGILEGIKTHQKS